MDDTRKDWEGRLAAAWVKAPELPPEQLVASIDALAHEAGVDPATSLFERASARDSAGLEAEAEQLYREALATEKLSPYQRVRVSIQLASTLRNLGRLQESEELLVAELDRHLAPGDPAMLHDEARAFLALTYLAQGRAEEAAGLALHTLAPHLSRYVRSLSAYSSEHVARTWDRP